MRFSVTVTLKKDVLDPQGKVVENTLKNLGMNDLKSIRQGKYFEIEVKRKINLRREQINQMCEKLLVNLIIENYKIANYNEILCYCFPGSNCDRDIAVALEKMQLKTK